MTMVRGILNAIGMGSAGKGAPVSLAPSALATYPVPLLLADGAGRVSAANPAGGALCALVTQGQAPGLPAAVARAVASGHALIEVVMVPGPAGTLLYELNVLPLADGTALVIAKDVTLESNLRSALVESRQRYKDLVEISTDFAWELGPEGSFVFVSPKGALGYRADELVGKSPAVFLIDQPALDNLLPFRSERPVEEAEIWMRRADGRAACLLASSAPLLDADGRRRGARGICRDITSERERDLALARASNRERLFNYIVRVIRDVVDPADMLVTAAEAIARALGATGCQIFRHRDGGFQPAVIFGSGLGDPEAALPDLARGRPFDGLADGRRGLGLATHYRQTVNGAILVWRDGAGTAWSKDEQLLLEDVGSQIGIANEQIAIHERVLTLSRTDALTGLFNRRAFFEELSRRYARLAHDRKPAALIYADLDNFKLVNDVHGHARGDEALLALREILVTHTRPSDLVARLGGDEFALYLEGADEAITAGRCRAILEAGERLRPFSGDSAWPLSLSLGAAVSHGDHPESLDELLSRADEAMYRVKRAGKSGFHIAPPPIFSTAPADQPADADAPAAAAPPAGEP